MAECSECGAVIDMEDPEQGEIIECPDCGVELEVLETDPIVLGLAPTEEEDWGE